MKTTTKIEDTIRKIETLKTPETKVVFVSGNFNVLHPGHMRLLTFAKECGDILVVGVTSDQTDGVLFEQEVRLKAIANLSFIEFAFGLEDSVDHYIKKIRPNIIVKGKEHQYQENSEQKIVDEYGGKLIFSSGGIKYSSIDLLLQEYEHLNPSTISRPEPYLTRRHILPGDLRRIVEDMKNKKVVVIGDTIVDEYITCDVLGLSQEDPTIVVSPMLDKKFIGGAAIVASHARGLGAHVDFFSIVGMDETAKFVKQTLHEYGVNAYLLVDDSRPTTFKQRFRTKEKTLLRVSHLRQHAISEELIEEMFDRLAPCIEQSDLIIFSDFNYGCIPGRLRNLITEYALKQGKYIVADCQSSSQIGDVSKYSQVNLLTPTEREARIGVGDFQSGLITLANSLKKKSQVENVLITLGSEGLLVHAHDEDNPDKYVTDRIPALNTAPKDTAGAGDCLLVTSSLALVAGANIWQGAYLGSIAAACQVGRIGNLRLKTEDLLLEI
ncbi:MAG: adenylyltransferase/cytidyltransferase family protein [Bacteriovoracaceae bacterium]|nr:adenylyltransferase/cytidyltransferase family protein [Bacteriovoracaceae bacterium]